MAGLKIESENWRVQRLGGAWRIKILAQKSDLSVESTQEDHTILVISAARGFNEPRTSTGSTAIPSAELFGYSYPIEITLIRDNLIILNPNDGSSLQSEGASGRFTAVGSWPVLVPCTSQ